MQDKSSPHPTITERHQIDFRILKISVLILALVLVYVTLFQPERAQARPASPWFSVNSSLDTDWKDNFLTLREAILVANGDLTGPFSAAEQTQLAGGGCTFDSSGYITSGCGAGYADAISFTGAITQVALTTPLPTLTDAGTAIFGGSGIPRLNAASIAGHVFTINGNNMLINGISIVNGTPSNSYADIFILSGKNAIIESNFLGTLPGATNCTPSGVTTKNDYGIYVGSNSSGGFGADKGVAFIYGNTLGCFNQQAIDVIGADYVYIGVTANTTTRVRNYIGVNSGGFNIGNGSDGVRIESASSFDGVAHSQINGNTIQNNGGNGIVLYGTGGNNLNSTTGNFILANQVLSNTLDGIALRSGAYINFIGSDSAADANVISGNKQNGVRIDLSDYNEVYTNTIGLTSASGSAYPNTYGILVTNSSYNSIRGNYISGNNADGLSIDNTAHHNTAATNTIGLNASSAIIPNAWSGVSILGGAHDNMIGEYTTVQKIEGNTLDGVFIAGNATTANTILNNTISSNGLDGITIQPGSNNNYLAVNTIASNAGSGIYINNSNLNTLTANTIYSNRYYGIILDGAGTTDTSISASTIHNNGTAGPGYDGIGERNGAWYNHWDTLSVYDNAGLGIDTSANSDSTNTIVGPFPSITSVTKVGGNVTVNGIATPDRRIELYYAAPDPSGYGEGKTYIGYTSSTGYDGTWSLTFAASAKRCYTATETRYFGGTLPLYSSEFGPNSCRTFLPLLVR